MSKQAATQGGDKAIQAPGWLDEGFSLEAASLSMLAELAARDFVLPRKPVDPEVFASVPSIAESLSQVKCPIVYTGFDGDHFALSTMMRRYVLRHGGIPANPENIVGYKDSVDSRQSKLGVLFDDLSVLSRCDELWIFTDVPADAETIASFLAEGAILELLYFLCSREARGEPSPVRLVPIASLTCRSRSSTKPRSLGVTYVQLKAALAKDQRRLVRIVEDVVYCGQPLPKLACLVHDPLDSKYMSWLRAGTYKYGFTPLVPLMAIDYADTSSFRLGSASLAMDSALAYQLTGWAGLSGIADELWLLPPVDLGRPGSYVVEILTALWQLREGGRSTVAKLIWSDFGVPKSRYGHEWALTEREKGTV